MSTTLEQTPSRNHEEIDVTESQSRALAEESRESDWVNPSFMKELFLGNFRFDLIDPYPERIEWRSEFKEYFEKLRTFLRDTWDPIEVDHSGEYNLFAICPFLFAFSKFWKFVCRLSTFEIGIGNVKNDQFVIQCEHIGDAAI